MLTSRQFSGLSRRMEAEGGFTTPIVGPKAGSRVTDVYSVGGQVPSHVGPAPIPGADIKAYATKHEERLQQPNVNLGGWHETETERALDVSQAFPRTPEGLRGAKGLALKTNQIAIGELNKKGQQPAYLGDIDNPFHVGPSSLTPEGRTKKFLASPAAWEKAMRGHVSQAMTDWLR